MCEPAVKRQRKNPTVRWTKDDVERIFDSIRSSANDFKKPTAQLYYLKIISCNTALQKFSWTAMRDKMINLKKKYRIAVDWRSNTGAGIDDSVDKERTIREYMLKLCPQFDALDELFGARASFQPMHIYDADRPDPQVVREEIVDDRSGNDDRNGNDDSSVIYDLEVEESRSDDPVESSTFEHFKTQLEKRPEGKRKDRPTSSIAQLAQVNRDRLEYQAKKLAADKEVEMDKITLEREKFDWQLQREQMQQEIERKRLELEEQNMKENWRLEELRVTEDIRLKELAQNQNFVLEKMKIEKEMLALELEREKMRNSSN